MNRPQLLLPLLLLPLSFACESSGDGGSSSGSEASEGAEGTGSSSDTTEAEASSEAESTGSSDTSESTSDTSTPDMGGEMCQAENEPCAFEQGLICCDELFCETPEGGGDTVCLTCRPLGAECYGNEECCSGVCSSEGQSGGLLVELCM